MIKTNGEQSQYPLADFQGLLITVFTTGRFLPSTLSNANGARISTY